MRCCVGIKLVFCAVTWHTRFAPAADIHWNGNSNAIWQNVNNWDPFGSPFSVHRVPGDFDTANFQTPASDSVSLHGDTAPINGLLVTSGIDIHTGGYLLQVDDAGSATSTIAGSGTSIFVAPSFGFGGLGFHTDRLFISESGILNLDGFDFGGNAPIDGTTTVLSQGQIQAGLGGMLHFGGDVLAADSRITARLASFSPGITFTAQSNAIVGLSQGVSVIDGVTFKVHTGARLESLSLNIGNDGQGAGSEGSVVVDSISVLDVQSNLTVGHAVDGSGVLRVANAVADIMGTTTVRATGTIQLEGASLFVARNSVLVDGGTITTTAGDDPIFLDTGVALTASNAGQVTIDGNQAIPAGTTFQFSSDADLSVTGNLRVGNSVGPGKLTVVGSGSTFDVDGELSIGRAAQPSMVTLANGAMGEVNRVDVGVTTGAAELKIESGAVLSSQLSGQVGVSPLTSGIATVTGAGSMWTTGSPLNVGLSGDGTLIIDDGGSVAAGDAVIGFFPGSIGTVTVTGSGSTLAGGNLTVGHSGIGLVGIENGGSITSTNGFIGRAPGSDAGISVTGAQSTWKLSGRLSIGGNAISGQNGGEGALSIFPGGTVNVAQDIVLFPDGLLRLAGGTLATASVSFEGGGVFDWDAGTLQVETFDGNLLNEGGTLAPGASAGGTTIVGDYTVQPGSGAILQIEIGGTATATEFDFVNVTGNAMLAGELQLSLINGFLPSPTDEFIVFNAASLLGFLTNAGNGGRLDTVDGLGSFQVNYGPTSGFNPNQIVLTDFEFAGLPGDYNDDGTVDAADYVVWRKNEGAPPGTLPNDSDGGVIRSAQYATWRANFGHTLGSGLAEGCDSLVREPEPASLAVLSVALLAVLCFRRASVSLTRTAMERAVAAPVWLLLLGAIAPRSPALAQGITEIIAVTGNAAPDGNGTFSTFRAPVLNNAAQAAFRASLAGTSGGTNDDTGIFLGAVGPLTQIARETAASPIGGPGLTDFDDPVLNDDGQVAFTAVRFFSIGGTMADGVFRGSGGPLTTIALEGNAAPDANGAFSLFAGPALNASGEVAFLALLSGTTFDQGVFVGFGGRVTQVAREGQSAPDGNGTFLAFGAPGLNSSGQLAFRGFLTGTSGGTSDGEGVFRGSGGPLTQIARGGQPPPDGDGRLLEFNLSPHLNASGEVAFVATLAGSSGGIGDAVLLIGGGGPLREIAQVGQLAPDGSGSFASFLPPMMSGSGPAVFTGILTGTSGSMEDNAVIYLAADGALTQVAREGQTVPDGNGTFQALLLPPSLNRVGQVLIVDGLDDTSGGATDDSGVFLANGIDMLQVAREGDSLADSTITGIVQTVHGVNGRSSINDAGQIAYMAELANGRQAIVRFTIPDIHWTAAGSGNWTTDANWTFHTEPNSFHDTFIDPATSLTVTAPSTHTTVASLSLGGGAGVATLRLAGALSGDVRALKASTIAANGVLLLSDGRTFSTPTLANSGVIRGAGTVDAMLSNSGRIEATNEELAFSRLVTNNPSSGFIASENASLRFDGGLVNHAAIALTLGSNRVFGDVNNAADGTVVVAGDSSVRFYDDVTNGGTLNVIGGSTAIFLGTLSGNGNVGAGDVQALGDLLPGMSTGRMTFAGDLTLGSLARLEIEIGGLTPGTQFDQLGIAADVELAGSLAVSLVDGFTLSAGDSFEIIDIGGTRSGSFTGLAEGGQVGTLGGVDLFVSYTGGDGNDVTLFTAAPLLAGDYNHNGTVDAADYVMWRKNEGVPPGALPNDINGGVIGHPQYATWRANFGNTAGSGSVANSSVPEPVTISLLATGSVTRLRRRSSPIRTQTKKGFGTLLPDVAA
jgi:T5SS/PEP-CTERM-associated repeat protein